MQLPEEFINQTRTLLGDERFSRFMAALDEEPPVSVRLNPSRFSSPGSALSPLSSLLSPLPWCPLGFYLTSRPQFTFDPLFHAGCYYVQEAASMFIDHVLRQYVRRPVEMLDLCAAPGGKSTAALGALPQGSVLVSNEPVRQRCQVLRENIEKWGYPNCEVTNLYPADFRKNGRQFDVILCDVPCSGEGMFRKDPAAVGEWSLQNVEKCWRLQRDIVSEAWQCLRQGGLLIYSTCTFNTKENEENLQWILQTFEADILPLDTKPEWGITGSLLEGFDAPVYRFIPGLTRSEGLFMAVVRKAAEPRVELSYNQAIAYLRGEALVLPADVPQGLVTLTFMGQALGQAKNLGGRANNLYPKPWRIKSTYIPKVYEAIFRPLE